MNNTAKNFLKGNYLIKKDKKIGTFLFNSNQSNFRNQLIKYILEQNSSSSRQIQFCDLQENFSTEQKNIIHLPSEQNFLQQQNSKISQKSILILLGTEQLFNTMRTSPQEFIQELENKLSEKTKQIFLFFYYDQLKNQEEYYELIQTIHFSYDFRNYQKEKLFNFISFSEQKIPSTQILNGEFLEKDFIIKIYIDKNTQLEKKNPDLLIQSTFKLGLNEYDQQNKDQLILPHYKDKQIEEMRQRVQEEEEDQYQYIDEEQEDLLEEIG